MTRRTVRADATVRRGRMSRAEQFASAALVIQELADESVDKAAASHLRALLAMKTLAGYSHTPISGDRARRARRAMDALMEAARAVA